MSNEPPRDPQPPPTSAANTDGPPAQRGEKRKRKRKSNQMLSQQTPDAKHLDANQSPSVEGTLRERNSDDKPGEKDGKKQRSELKRNNRRAGGLFKRVKDDEGNDMPYPKTYDSRQHFSCPSGMPPIGSRALEE